MSSSEDDAGIGQLDQVDQLEDDAWRDSGVCRENYPNGHYYAKVAGQWACALCGEFR